ncbi:MAG TPA: DUF3788 family protein [Brevefilum fermentans]|nr:DUF3788 family protein [Brevefilum fermentans]
MIDERLLDRNNPPEPELIRQVIGDEAFPLWEQVNQFLQEQYPDFQGGMTYYNAQRGWGQDYRKGAQRLCMLFPERGGLTAFLTLSQDGEEAAQARIRYFNARLRTLLNQPSALPQGRWLWMRLEDYTDLVSLKLLLEITSSYPK